MSLSFPAIEDLLFGHVSEETAFLVHDYPYGFRLRCSIRYWIETNPKLGDRFCSQTTNPKAHGEVWNKPKKSTYYKCMVMYKDAKGHVNHLTIHPYEERPFVEQVNFMIPILDKFNRHQIESIRIWYYMHTQVSMHYDKKYYPTPEGLTAFEDWTRATLRHIAKCDFRNLLQHPQAPQRTQVEGAYPDKDFDWYIGVPASEKVEVA